MDRMWRNGALALALGLLAIGGGGSSCSCEDSGSISEVTKVEIALSTNQLSFPSARVGETTSEVFFVQNASSEGGLLKVTSVTLNAAPAFSLTCSKGTGAFDLAAGETAQCELALTPTGQEELTGSIVFNSNASNRDDGVVLITTLSLRQDIEADPPRASFNAREGQTSRKLVTIRNVGNFPLEVYGFEVTGQSDVFSAEVDSEIYGSFSESNPLTLDPHNDNINEGDPGFKNNELQIFVTYAPETTGSDAATLLVHSNDPDSDVLPVELTANSNAPCILVLDGTRVDFGSSRIGDLHQRTITVQNCGNDTLEINQLEPGTDTAMIDDVTSNSSFVIDPGATRTADNTGLLAEPIEIAPGETDSFVVGYAPTAEVPHSGKMFIHSNDDFNPRLQVELFGRGVINQCPTAVAKGTVRGMAVPPSTQVEAAPLQYLIMDGSDSSDIDGSVVDYVWEVIERPDGSVAEPGPVANEPADPARRQLFLDLAGRFVIQLTAIDDGGTPSCETATITALVVPNEAIHVQLVWNNPADPDQVDLSGSDVDMHFLKMGPGRWFNSPYDNYFGNREPFFNPEHPSLDIDDTNGAGPENINLDDPVPCQWYAVAIHYWRQQFGTAYTTVRIYINGLLVFEALNKPLTTTGDWWDVARIHWPSGQVLLVDTLEPAPPRAEDAPVTDAMIQSGLCGVDELLGN